MIQKVRLTFRSAVASVALASCVIVAQGCSKQTNLQVVAEVNTHIPEVVAAADTVAQVVTGLLPTDAALIAIASTAFDTGAKTIQALTASYIANPSATTLQQIQSAIGTLEAQVNSATLQAARIKNPQTQAAVLAALKGLLTIATVIFALIAPTLSSAQTAALQGNISLVATRRYMDEAELHRDLPGVNLDRAFAYAGAHGM